MASVLLKLKKIIDACIGDDQIIVMSVQPCYIINYGKRVRQWVGFNRF